ncbi:MAG: CCA tRNA nucleotidyltransferase [Phycisphaeraceae bacterium]
MQEQTDKRAAAERIVGELRKRGHVAYFAGGCVRDMLLGVEPKDYDVATDAPPEVVKSVFRNTKLVGEAFGVVLVRLMRCEIEVATFRTEGAYSDGRRPDQVRFTDAEHDAKRRDLTINGLFYDPGAPPEDKVIDFVGGRADIEGKIIRAIGEPGERFAEDYLRMLRTVRFAARLGWEIDPPTAEAIRGHAKKLEQISRERIGMEVLMMMAGPGKWPVNGGRASAARWMQKLGLDGPVLKEPGNDRPVKTLEALTEDADAVTALAAWALDRHLEPKGDLAERLTKMRVVLIARRWRDALVLSNDQVGGLLDRLLGLAELATWKSMAVANRKRLLARAEWEAIRQLAAAQGEFDMKRLTREAKKLREDKVGVQPKPLVTGDDLVAIGMMPGPVFKRILDTVYDAQLEGRITSRKDAMRMVSGMDI